MFRLKTTRFALAGVCIFACIIAQEYVLVINSHYQLTRVYVDGIEHFLPNANFPNETDNLTLPAEARVLAVQATSTIDSCAGFIGSVTVDYAVTNSSWKCSPFGGTNWYGLGFDDTTWLNAYEVGRNGIVPECPNLSFFPEISLSTFWIWTAPRPEVVVAPDPDSVDKAVFCRGYLPFCAVYQPCQNGGTCLENNASLCHCPLDWVGKYCEIPKTPCASDPCQHNEICFITGDSYVCECRPYYTGINCEFLNSSNEALIITAFQQLDELYIDGTMVQTLPNGGVPNAPDYVTMENNTRLIALRAINIDPRVQCSGVLASAFDNSIITDNRFKCVESVGTDWSQLGFDDSLWEMAGEYGDNTVGRIDCSQNEPIADIDPNAKWIWTNILNYPIVYCRGYTTFCDTSSPCLNGGTCLKNDQAWCLCLPQFTGEFCETALSVKLTITVKSTLYEIFVDGVRVPRCHCNDASLPEEIELQRNNQLIAVTAIDTTGRCAGILASVTNDILVTNPTWKCTTDPPPNWYTLGFNDDAWNDAYAMGPNHNVTSPMECSSVLPGIDSISENASWIWTPSILELPFYDYTIHCRALLPTCDQLSICMNGGRCNRNNVTLCTCLPGYTGVFCESELEKTMNITAKSVIYELFVDEIRRNLTHNDDWKTVDGISLSPKSRLVAILAADASETCAGILASVTDDYLVTDATWKCDVGPPPDWYRFDFDDSAWPSAYVIGPNGNVTWPGECRVLTEIPTVSQNANWIWTPTITGAPYYDHVVYCRAYLPFCETAQPCQNGGTCNRNSATLCSCPGGFTGIYCESIL